MQIVKPAHMVVSSSNSVYPGIQALPLFRKLPTETSSDDLPVRNELSLFKRAYLLFIDWRFFFLRSLSPFFSFNFESIFETVPRRNIFLFSYPWSWNQRCQPQLDFLLVTSMRHAEITGSKALWSFRHQRRILFEEYFQVDSKFY